MNKRAERLFAASKRERERESVRVKEDKRVTRGGEKKYGTVREREAQAWVLNSGEMGCGSHRGNIIVMTNYCTD